MTEESFPWALTTERAEASLLRGIGLASVPLPPGLDEREGRWKGERVSIVTRAYSGGPIEYARFAIVRGAGLEIGNILCVPFCRYPLPILGADLVAVRHDTGMLAIDLSPTLPPGQERETQLHAVARARASHPVLPPGGTLPAWCADWFSPHAVYTRGSPADLRAAPAVVHDLVTTFLRMVDDCAPRPELDAHVGGVRQGYLAAHRTDDKGLNLLGKMFGQEWAERYVREVLFPDMPPDPTGIDLFASTV